MACPHEELRFVEDYESQSLDVECVSCGIDDFPNMLLLKEYKAVKIQPRRTATEDSKTPTP